MWSDVEAALEADGVVALEQYLSAEAVPPLVHAFDAPESGEDAATLVKRGVVFARRNLLGIVPLQQFIAGPEVQSLIDTLTPGHVAVRGILFDKTGDANWTVPWHQDRSIAVAARHDTPGFGPWSRKAEVVHVQPPVELLRSMVTLRFSLDPCGAENGPLRAIPGTHHSLMSQTEVVAAVEQSAETACTTDAGGVVIMRPLLLHASSPARHATRRRVMHIEFGPPELPGELQWAMA